MKHLNFTFLSIIILIACTSQTNKYEYNPKAVKLNNKGGEFYQQGDYDSAIAYYNQAIELDSNYYLPHFNKVTIFLARKEYKNALKESELVNNKKPDLAEGWTFTGMIYDFLGDSLNAKSYYKHSIEIYDKRIINSNNKQSIEANKLNRAFSLILLGKENEGKAEFKSLKSENPDPKMIDEFLKMNKKEYIIHLIGNEK